MNGNLGFVGKGCHIKIVKYELNMQQTTRLSRSELIDTSSDARPRHLHGSKFKLLFSKIEPGDRKNAFLTDFKKNTQGALCALGIAPVFCFFFLVFFLCASVTCEFFFQRLLSLLFLLIGQSRSSWIISGCFWLKKPF